MKSAASAATRAVCLILVCAMGCQAPTTEADLLAGVQTHIEQLVAEGEVPSIAIAVARDGKILWEQGFGLADRQRRLPATEHTPYPLASISKPLTATGLMVLAEQGLIDLEAPIDDYLGQTKLRSYAGDSAQATVRRVASHTAGLPLHDQHFYDGETKHPPCVDKTIERYGILVTAPGERYQYSNLGYGLLGHALSQVSGQGYAQVMQAKVFRPLGMDQASVYAGSGLEKGQAVKYMSSGAVVPPCETDSPGASAIYASAQDLIRFAMLHLQTPLPDQQIILGDATLDAMQQPSPETGPLRPWEQAGSGYGIGWFIGVTEDGLRVVQHSGGTLGVSAVLALVPEQRLAVVVLSNTDSPWPDVIAIETLCALLSYPPEAFLLPADKTAREIERVLPPEWAGTWQGNVHTCEGKVPLALEVSADGTVYATMGDQQRTPLRQVSYRDSQPQFMNAGGGPFLRGCLVGDLNTEDASRGSPYKLWLELKLREGQLTGVLIAFSQRTLYTGPLSHWVTLDRRPPAPLALRPHSE